jgi:L-amino acid N-acyltransferase YncA
MPRRPPPVLSFVLDDGTPVALRAVMPADRERILAGFEALSEDTRTLRFLAPIAHLSEAQLRYFTEVDHVDHVAWGALDLRETGNPGFGVGRWVRLPEAPGVAEYSLTVADEAQGHGLGALLFAVLYVLAATLEVRTLRGVIARTNGRMVQWMRRLGARPVDDGDPMDSAVTLDLPVTPDLASLPDNETARHFAALVGQVRRASVEHALPTNPWRIGLLG